MRADLHVVLECDIDTKKWHCYCPDLGVSVKDNTPRQAVVKFANSLKALKAEKIEGVLA